MPAAGSFPDLVAGCQRGRPEVFLVLGSGLGKVSDRVRPEVQVPFADIPGLPAASVPGHGGSFTLGGWQGRRVLVQEGRLHFYEGHPWETVLRPVRLAAELGARIALFTNASGGIAPEMDPGTIAILKGAQDWTAPDAWRPRLARILAFPSDCSACSGMRRTAQAFPSRKGPTLR